MSEIIKASFLMDDNGQTLEIVDQTARDGLKFNFKNQPLPVLELTGDTTGMSKDDAVTMNYVYGDRSGTCTVKWQGSSSIRYPKKNYTIKFDNVFEAKEGWGEQSKYCLKANWIDASHCRNVVNAKLWGQICASRKPTNSILAACPNWGAVDGFPIVIAINGEFHGLYTFNIPKDGWMANMGSGTHEAILCADTQRGACQFRAHATFTDDFEVEYATDKNDVEWAKTSLNDLIDACILSDGSDIDTTIAEMVDVESAIDYFIFTAFVTGLDMCYKNYLLFKRDGEPWVFGAYDMDCTYSLSSNGSKFESALANPTLGYYGKGHKLMNLLLNYKTVALQKRYKELRETVLSEDNIYQVFINFAGGIPKAVKTAESNRWPDIPNSDSNTIYQIFEQLRLRLPVLDAEMEAFEQTDVVDAPMLAVGPSWFNVQEAGVEQSAITSVSYEAGYEPTGDEDAYWSCDANGSGTIVAYRTGTEIVITPTNGASKIRLNPDSNDMFANDNTHASFSALAEVKGTNMWVANQGTSMQRLLMSNTLITEPVYIPDGVTAANSMFNGCRALLTPPEIPDGVVTLDNMFITCVALTRLPAIPATAKNLRYFAMSCQSVTSVDLVIPEGVTNMQAAFRGCKKMNGNIEINTSKLTEYGECFTYTCLESGSVTLTGTCPLLAELAATNTEGKVTVATA